MAAACIFDVFMSGKDILTDHMDKIHTTPLGADRIRRNLALDGAGAVEYCKAKIMKEDCRVYRKGKNWYCEIDGIRITVNAYSYTIITAHRMK